MSKGGKMTGEQVTKEEVLAELGNPATWAANERRLEFQKRLHRGETDMNISGILGTLGKENDGYLGYLRKSLTAPLGSGTGLVSEEENNQILARESAAISVEITRYEARLEELERDPEAVETYIRHLRGGLGVVNLFGDQDPDEEDDEELKELAKAGNEDRALCSARIRADIERYTALLERLRSQG